MRAPGASGSECWGADRVRARRVRRAFRSTGVPAWAKSARLALACLLAGCGGDLSANDYVNDHGGDLGVYERIAELTDCNALRREFDVAAANNDRAEAGTAAQVAAVAPAALGRRCLGKGFAVHRDGLGGGDAVIAPAMFRSNSSAALP